MKVSVVLSICNRTNLFRRGLWTLSQQTMPKADFEIIVANDSRSVEDVHAELTPYIGELNMQYAVVDESKCDIPVYGHTPALTNNVGFRLAKGEVIVISQPEILHDRANLECLYESARRPAIVFGNIRHSAWRFTDDLNRDPDESWKRQTWDEWFRRPAADDKTTLDILNGGYWFVAALPKWAVDKMRGVDEEYLRGVYGEDDNFRERAILAGCPKFVDERVRGIHQNHEDEKWPQQIRNMERWEIGSNINRARYADFKRLMENNCAKPEANEGRIWGNLDTIIDYRCYRILADEEPFVPHQVGLYPGAVNYNG